MRKNGIFYGWFVLAATFFAMFMVTGARNGFGTFIIPMGDELQWDRGTISLAIAIGWLCNGVSQPFLGRLYDRYGGRTVISVSLLVVGTCTMLLSQVNDMSVFGLFVLDRFWFLVGIYGFVISVASGGASLVTIHAVLARWFSRKRGLAISISTAGASAGSLVLVPFAAYMIELAGWRNTWIILGAFVVFFALPLAWMLVRNDPSEMGEQQDGDAAPGEGGAGRANAARRGPLEVDYWRDALKSAPIWQLTGAYFVCGMTTAIISAHYIPFAVEKGIDPRVAALAFGMMSALNIAGRTRGRLDFGQSRPQERFGLHIRGPRPGLRGAAYAARRVGNMDLRGDCRLLLDRVRGAHLVAHRRHLRPADHGHAWRHLDVRTPDWRSGQHIPGAERCSTCSARTRCLSP